MAFGNADGRVRHLVHKDAENVNALGQTRRNEDFEGPIRAGARIPALANDDAGVARGEAAREANVARERVPGRFKAWRYLAVCGCLEPFLA